MKSSSLYLSLLLVVVLLAIGVRAKPIGQDDDDNSSDPSDPSVHDQDDAEVDNDKFTTVKNNGVDPGEDTDPTTTVSTTTTTDPSSSSTSTEDPTTTVPSADDTTTRDSSSSTTTSSTTTSPDGDSTTTTTTDSSSTTTTSSAETTPSTSSAPSGPTTTSAVVVPDDDGGDADAEDGGRGFSGWSFFGGIILTLVCFAIGFVGFKYYKVRGGQINLGGNYNRF